MIADPLTFALAILSAFGCGVFAYPTVSKWWAVLAVRVRKAIS